MISIVDENKKGKHSVGVFLLCTYSFITLPTNAWGNLANVAMILAAIMREYRGWTTINASRTQ